MNILDEHVRNDTSDKHVRWNSYEHLYEDLDETLDEHKYGYKDEHYLKFF